jgi:tetratricopeptide (TPR) repeat protein
VAFELARAYEAAGRREQARAARGRFALLRQMATEKAVLAKRCAGDPGSFDNHYRLGLLLMRMGDYPLAYHYLRRARDLRPHHPPVAAALRSLAALTGLPARADAVAARAATAKRPATAPAGSTP